MNQLGSVLVAYALEHLDDAIGEADRLLAEYEGLNGIGRFEK